MTGWVKIHRSLLDKNWTPAKKYAWVWLILNARYSGDERGTIIVDYQKMAQEWGVTKSTVYQWLKDWKDIGKISEKNRKAKRVISITKYCGYQDKKESIGKESERNRKGSGKIGSDPQQNQGGFDVRKKERKNSKKVREEKEVVSLSLNQQFSDYFVEAYQKHHGEKYQWRGTRDGKHLKDLRKMAGDDLEVFKRKVDAFFSGELSWIKGGRDMGLLVHQWNKLVGEAKIDWDKELGIGKDIYGPSKFPRGGEGDSE